MNKKAGSFRPFYFFAFLARSDCFGCHMDQGAGIGIFQHPQRTIGAFFDIADAVTHIPAFGGFGAAMAVKDNAVEGLRSNSDPGRE